MSSKELCQWLRDNSSGIYRPSARAADRIELLEEALREARDWINETSASKTGPIGVKIRVPYEDGLIAKITQLLTTKEG